MLISKRDLTRILVDGLPLHGGDVDELVQLYKREIEAIDSSVYECYPDDLQHNVLRIFMHNKEVFDLTFDEKLCVFKTSMHVSELKLFKEEIYGMILRMVAFENIRTLPELVLNDYKQTKYNKNFIRHMTKNAILNKGVKALKFKNKKYEWN